MGGEWGGRNLVTVVLVTVVLVEEREGGRGQEESQTTTGFQKSSVAPTAHPPPWGVP